MVRNDLVRVADESRVHPLPQQHDASHDRIDLSRESVGIGGIHHDPGPYIEQAENNIRDIGAERDEETGMEKVDPEGQPF